MNVQIYTPSQQGSGSFDGGTITERKPIGFPGEGSEVQRLGPLFYFAWAFADKEGYIASHPHQAFEIMTYVIQGEAHHGDSLGTNSVVGPGGVQLIQAGSGVSHNERIVGPSAELFQIWFEPSIQEALKRPPTYNQYEHDEFPRQYQDSVLIKTVIGDQSPIDIVADAKMWDLEMPAGSAYNHKLSHNRAIAILAIRGDLSYIKNSDITIQFSNKDFVIVETDEGEDSTLTIRAGLSDTTRLILIEVPTKVDYPLYQKRR